MTPERASQIVVRWIRFYTRTMHADIAQRRIAEIESDLHDHITHERAASRSDRLIALSILSRAARGLPADTSWRRQVQQTKGNSVAARKDTAKQVLTIIVALLLAAIGIAGIVYGEADDSPGGQLIGVLLVIGAIWLGVRTATTFQRNR